MARQAIRKLVSDHRYDYIETGSLISIKQNIKGIRIPSEETRLTLHPMDYEEFRWALSDDVTIPLLREAFDSKHPLGDGLARKLMRDFRQYMIVGGMPKAVSTLLETNLDYVYENIVAQMLSATGNRLFYHTWQSETSNHLYEVDFLLSRGGKLWPLEVKSSGYKTHKSLDEFCRKFAGHISNRYLIYTKDMRKNEETTFLPAFMTMFL